MKLSIVFPAYNEEKRILPVLKNYYSFFRKKLGGDFEIIIIPNNCSDNTIKIVKDFCADKNQASFFEIRDYSGKGGAVAKGFSLAKGNLVSFVDSDESTSPKEFFRLYSNIKNNDGIIGSRRIKGAKVFPKRNFKKRMSSLIFNLIVRLLFGLKYKDTQCGAKIFKKDVVKYFVKSLKEKGWIFDVDLLILSKKKNYKIKEYPINWRDDSYSHLKFLGELKSLFSLLRYRISS